MYVRIGRAVGFSEAREVGAGGTGAAVQCIHDASLAACCYASNLIFVCARVE